jgi:hypothetical protein
VAASIRRSISFPAPRRFHSGARQRRQGLVGWSSITPSSTAAAASAQSSAAFISCRSRENHPSPTPLPRQIPIDRQTIIAFPRVPSSEAFRRRPPILDRSLAPGRAGIRNPSQLQTFPRVPSSEAFGRRLFTGSTARDAPASETLHDSGRSPYRDLTPRSIQSGPYKRSLPGSLPLGRGLAQLVSSQFRYSLVRAHQKRIIADIGREDC